MDTMLVAQQGNHVGIGLSPTENFGIDTLLSAIDHHIYQIAAGASGDNPTNDVKHSDFAVHQ
jgi:hypothetical protein